jgi:hypothetical protein
VHWLEAAAVLDCSLSTIGGFVSRTGLALCPGVCSIIAHHQDDCTVACLLTSRACEATCFVVLSGVTYVGVC